jgi:hypothetical protein
MCTTMTSFFFKGLRISEFSSWILKVWIICGADVYIRSP